MLKRIVNLTLVFIMFFTTIFFNPLPHEGLAQEMEEATEQAEDNADETTQDTSDEGETGDSATTDDGVEGETEDSTTTTDEGETEDSITTTDEGEAAPAPTADEGDSVTESTADVEGEVTEEIEDPSLTANVGASPNVMLYSATGLTDLTSGFTFPVDSIQGPDIQKRFNPVTRDSNGRVTNGVVDQSGAQGNMMILTDKSDDAEQMATARWFNRQVDLNKDFTIEMYVYMNDHDKSGLSGDGLTFTMHNDERETGAIGAINGGLGAYDLIESNRNGRQTYKINNGLSIEFDMYNNVQNEVGIINRLQTWNYDGDIREPSALGDGDRHTALVQTDIYDSSIIANPDRMKHLSTKPILNPHSDKWRQLTITWKYKGEYKGGGSGTLRYEFNQNPDNEPGKGAKIDTTHTFENIDAIFGTSSSNRKVWWGITASTGTYDKFGPIPRNQYATMDSAVAFESIPHETAEIKMEVRNATQDGEFADGIVQAYPGDVLEYKYTFTNPRINGVYDGWTINEVTNISNNENIFESFPKVIRETVQVNFDVENNTSDDLSGTFNISPDVEPGASSELIATAAGVMTDTMEGVNAISNPITVEILPLEVKASQTVENTTYSAGNEETGQKLVDVMEGDKIELTAQLQLAHNSTLPINGQYSVTLPSDILDIEKIEINKDPINNYSLNENTLTIEIKGVQREKPTTIQIYATINKITEESKSTLITRFNPKNKLVKPVEPVGFEISFIPKIISFEIGDLDFGSHVISAKDESFPGENKDFIRIVTPTRSEQTFSVRADYDKPLLPDTTIIDKKSGKELKEIEKNEFTTEQTDQTRNIYTYNAENLELYVPAGRALVGDSSTKITWTLQLQDAPNQ